MSIHRSNAVLIGLLEGSKAKEWIVTEKLGNALKQRPSCRTQRRQQWQFIIDR